MGSAFDALIKYRDSIVSDMDTNSKRLRDMQAKMVKGVNATTAYRWQYSIAAIQQQQQQASRVLQTLNQQIGIREDRRMKTFTEFVTEGNVLQFPASKWQGATPTPAPEPAPEPPAEPKPKANILAVTTDVVERMQDALNVASRIDAEQNAKRDYPWAKDMSQDAKIQKLVNIHKDSRRFTVKDRGSKYIAIDIGGSGKFLVEKSTGDVYGIKGYGVIHRGYRFGNVYEPDIKRLVVGAMGHLMSRASVNMDYSRY